MLESGDRVQVKERYGERQEPNGLRFSPGMHRFLNRVVTIREALCIGHQIRYRIEGEPFLFSEDMFTPDSVSRAERLRNALEQMRAMVITPQTVELEGYVSYYDDEDDDPYDDVFEDFDTGVYEEEEDPYEQIRVLTQEVEQLKGVIKRMQEEKERYEPKVTGTKRKVINLANK